MQGVYIHTKIPKELNRRISHMAVDLRTDKCEVFTQLLEEGIMASKKKAAKKKVTKKKGY